MENTSTMIFKKLQARKQEVRESNTSKTTPKIAMVKPNITSEYISGSVFLTDVTPDLIKRIKKR